MPVGWPTPNAGPQNDTDSKWQERRATLKAEHKNGNGFGMTLGMAASLTGWPSPNAMPLNRGGLQTNPVKAMERVSQGHQMNLDDAATLAGWATPTSRDHKDTGSLENVEINCLLGRQVSLSPAPTERPAGLALNPEFSRWLMGFPAVWGSCGATAMRLSRKSRRSS